MTGHRVAARELARLIGSRDAPTSEQVRVVESPLEPLLVVAGAGSGKTETMAARVVWLVANRLVEPQEVLALTFTRKAAGELAERVASRLRALGRRAEDRFAVGQRPRVATYNAYAGGLVREHALRVGADPEARLLSEAGRWQLATRVVEGWTGELPTGPAVSTVVAAVLELSGALAEHLLTPDRAALELGALAAALEDKDEASPGRGRGPRADVRRTAESLRVRARLMPVVAEFARRKAEAGLLDFADEMALACRIARTVPDVRELERQRHRVVLLDEYQDTSVAQEALLSALYDDAHPVTAVGDPHQAIYGWRGASAGSAERFPSTFPLRDGGPAPVATLTTSWRNDRAVLAAANVLAGPLRAAAARRGDDGRGIGLPELAARPAAAVGEVSALVAQTAQEEAEQVAAWLDERRHPPGTEGAGAPGAGTTGRGTRTATGTETATGARTAAVTESATGALTAAGTETTTGDGAPRSAAVLCRARAQMPAVVAALRERGLPVEVVGLGGLLHEPEIADLHAALLAAHDPGRNDAAMRLLTGLRLGVADLAVLHERAQALARRASRPGGLPKAAPASGDPGGVEPARPGGRAAPERASLVEAVESPPPPSWSGRSGRTLTAVAHHRVRRLGDVLRAIRSSSHLPLPELVGAAERLLGLDIEVLAQPGADRGRARRHLDEFAEVAAGFTDGSPEPSLGGFLAWLEAAQEHERGLDPVEPTARPDAVQVLTVHAAKGLEWDVVAVVGLADGAFPAYDGPVSDHPASSAWLTALDALPYPLRGDAADLPRLDVDAPTDHGQMAAEWADFRVRAGRHALREERRLAYVAATRARRELLLSGSWWRRQARQPRDPSRFLRELRRSGALTRVLGSQDWDRPGYAQNPEADRPARGVWPAPEPADHLDIARRGAHAVARLLDEGRTVRWRGAAADVGDAAAAIPAGASRAQQWARDVRLLLAERAARAAGGGDVALPTHLSASAVVRLVADPAAFALELRRPVPREPTARARRGTLFHSWVEQHFGGAALLDVDDLPSVDDHANGDDADLDELRRAFLASPWAARTPIAVEVPLETPIGGTVVRCRVDAVFATTDGVQIVDWKTGPPPRDPGEAAARQAQLALYRLAWSRLHRLPLGSVTAAFVHVAHGVVVPAARLDEGEVVAAVTASLAQAVGTTGGGPERGPARAPGGGTDAERGGVAGIQAGAGGAAARVDARAAATR